MLARAAGEPPGGGLALPERGAAHRHEAYLEGRGLLSGSAGPAARRRGPSAQRGAVSPVAAIATIGAILIALGVAWVFISNWQQFGTAVKILVLCGATTTAFTAAVLTERKGYDWTGEALYLLTALLWTLSIFIIAQQFHYGRSFQENTHLFGLSTLGAGAIAYVMRSRPSLFLALVMFYAWATAQAAAYGLDFGARALRPGFSAVTVTLGLALLYFGLGLSHRARGDPEFAKIYTWFASGAILLLGFTFTLQAYQPLLAVSLGTLWSWYSVFFIVIPVAVTALGIRGALARGDLSLTDATSGLVVWAIYVLSAILLPQVLGTGLPVASLPAWAGSSIWKMGPGFIVQWLYFNAVFIVLMLTIIDFAAREHRTALMNLSLNTFGLYILARYAGFMMDLQGYLPFSLMLILGGIGLLALSMAYHRFRRFAREKAA